MGGVEGVEGLGGWVGEVKGEGGIFFMVQPFLTGCAGRSNM